MNTNSNQDLQFQLIPESEQENCDLRGVSTFRKMLTIGGIALMSMLVPLGTENINGKQRLPQHCMTIILLHRYHLLEAD